MRTFKCYDCNHTWELAYGEGGRGVEQQCPACGSRNVHRADAGSGANGSRGRGWKGRGRGAGGGGRGRGFGGVFQVAENDQNQESS